MKLAIIAGRGNFPSQIAKENPGAFVLCIENHSFTSAFKNKSEIISLKDPLSWISILKKNKQTVEINEITPIIIKNFGQMNLKKILASLLLIRLFIAGAINIVWNIIIPEIIDEQIKGR